MLVEAGHEVVGSTRSPEKTAELAALGAEPVVVDALDEPAVMTVWSSKIRFRLQIGSFSMSVSEFWHLWGFKTCVSVCKSAVSRDANRVLTPHTSLARSRSPREANPSPLGEGLLRDL
jgi:hypothetical protein